MISSRGDLFYRSQSERWSGNELIGRDVQLMLWRWKALDEQGNILKGIWEERDRKRVAVRLREQNYFPLQISRDLCRSLCSGLMTGKAKMYWSRTARKMGTMLAAGVPLLTVLEIIADKEKNTSRKVKWYDVSKSVREGKDLAASLENFYPQPGQFAQAMIVTGEYSGKLADSFLEIADELEDEYLFEQKIKTALFYPLILFIMVLIVIYSLSIVVFPLYQVLYQDLQAELPFITRTVFTIGSFIPQLTAFIILIILLFAAEKQISFYLSRPSAGSMFRESFPLVGQLSRNKELILFFALLARLLEAGYPLLQALILLEGTVKGTEMKKIIGELKCQVTEGRRLTPVFLKHSSFPLEAARMIETAEETGKLCEMLGNLARIYRYELEEKLRQFTKFLEPLLVIVLAGFVGLIAIAVLLPIFEVSMHIR